MDQSTQVNFPVISKNQQRQMRRHNTSADLYYSNNRVSNLSGSWTQLKSHSTRPKSLNITVEPLGRPIKYNSESPISRLSYPVMDIPNGSISRERTPPFSCNSSIASFTGGLNNRPTQYISAKNKLLISDDDSTATSKCCRFSEMETGCRFRKDFSNTSEGLSWRRLHMSRAKLKATATTSELLSGFAMIAMVELQINEKTSVPEWLFVVFAVCTTILVAVHIFALMISTYILPNIDAIAKLEICEIVGESPHERLRGLIELAWAFSTILGLFLFLVEVAILCWVKFWDYSFTAAIAATVIVVPVLVIFVIFAVHYYHSLVVFKCNSSTNDMQKLEEMKKQLDDAVNNKIV